LISIRLTPALAPSTRVRHPQGDRRGDADAHAEQIKAAMRFYVSNEFYCRACREGAPRINLLGHEAGVVTSAEADNAVARLAGIREWKKKKKDKAAKAKAEARAAAKAAEIEAARPKPHGINASKPKLTLGSLRRAAS